MWRVLRALLVPVWFAVILAGCTQQDKNAIGVADIGNIDFDAGLKACCPSDEKFPVAVVDFTEANSLWVLPFARNTILRPAYLTDQPGAHAYLLDQAEPLDLIAAYNGGRLSGASGEGYFGHMVIYTGNEAQLRALGVWDHPAVAKFHQRIRAGGIAIEAVDVGVRLGDRREVLEADAAAIFRPTGFSRARKRRAIVDFFTEIGKPFDFHFSLSTPDVYYCTELINKVLPEMNMPVSLTYGRPSIWPDEFVAGVLRGKNPARFMGYVFGSKAGWDSGDEWLMAARIFDAWPLVSESQIGVDTP
ncbi:MAG: hypothetical protein GY945_05170 [Rhodobacteraceae bacterium]|nr:hypothetical protein [Paracoccaceae bacterium]